MEKVLEGKIVEINLIKAMLLAEIEAVQHSQPIKQEGVLKGCVELNRSIEIVRDILSSLKHEIMSLPAILG
jgi:hypothetical protein